MRAPEVHGIEFFAARDLHGRPTRLAIGIADSGAVAIAVLEEGQPLVVDDGTTVLALAPAEVSQVQRRLSEAMITAASQQQED
jgi:hypothetical protein